jgi:hypothetical protein
MTFDARNLVTPGETRVVVTARARGTTPLDAPRLEPPPPDLDSSELARLLSDAKYPDNVWLVGGEPTLHAELPRLLRAVGRSRVGLVTDGLPLAEESALAPLISAGLSDARIRLQAARLDAHDFMVQKKGAARRALGALKALKKAGVRVELATNLSRMNAAGLHELVELSAELGVRTLHVERLSLPPDARELAVSWLVRLPLVEPALERAVERARALGVQLSIAGFPHCFMGRAAMAAADPGAVQYLVSASFSRAPWSAPEAAQRCDGCSGSCGGAAPDYVARFGPTELFAARPTNETSTGPNPDKGRGKVPLPPPRGARLPSVRLEVVRQQARQADLGGDPVSGAGSREPEPALRFGWRGTGSLGCSGCDDAELPRSVETTRSIRQRLVRAAQYGAPRLRVVGADLLSHPGALELLEELPRLSFKAVELGTLFAPRSPEMQIAAFLPALSALARVDMALFGADTNAHDGHLGTAGSFARTLEGAARLSDAGVAGGCFAVLHSAEPLAAFADAWATRKLPGSPAFRLAEAGGSLDELASRAERLTTGAALALCALLPACLGGRTESAGQRALGPLFIERAEPGLPASSADPVGRFLPCQCGPERAASCPGVAAGWTSTKLAVQK